MISYRTRAVSESPHCAESIPESAVESVPSVEHNGTLPKEPNDDANVSKTRVFEGVSSKPELYAFAPVEPPVKSRSYQSRLVHFKHDIITLSEADLRFAYSVELDCWYNMKRRVKARGGVVHDAFLSFPLFLAHMGPQPKKSYTVDRIDNANLDYGPFLVRWANKTVQSRNRSNVRKYKCPKTARVYLTHDLAALHRISTARVRRRHHDGWSTAEQIAGYKLKLGDDASKPASTQVSEYVDRELSRIWKLFVDEVCPGEFNCLTPAGRKQLQHFAAYCDEDDFPVIEVLYRVTQDWGGFTERVSAEHGVPLWRGGEPAMPLKPQIGFVLRYVATALNHWVMPINDYEGKEYAFTKVEGSVSQELIDKLEPTAAKAELAQEL